MFFTYRRLIFDFNGTLFFDNDKHVKAWEEISQLIRGKALEEELQTHCNVVPNAKIIEYFLGDGSKTDLIEKYSYLKEEMYRLLCKKDVANFHLVDGAESYFDQLKREEIPFTIDSASIKENVDFFVENFYLDNWMDSDSIIYDDGTYDNKVAIFLDVAKVIGVPIEECLIVEDSISKIKNAYVAGCCNIVVVVDSVNKKEEYEQLPSVKK